MSTLYDTIGTTYAVSRRADPSLADALAMLLDLNASRKYLDVACGTGNYTTALSTLGGAWTGVDISDVMLAEARKTSAAVSWLLANASDLPFHACTFDGAICTLAIHHFKQLDRAFAEVRRVLRSGTFVLFTGLSEQMQNYWLCHYFPSMMRRSIENMPSEHRIRESLLHAGFSRVQTTPYFVTPELKDLFLYSGKDRPDHYLDTTIRQNISSFARLSTPDELQRGLHALAQDLRTGAFESVRAKYSSSDGDYAFLVAHAAG